MNEDDASPAAALSGARERKIIFLLCLLAAVHAFIFSATFPFFNNVDEQAHFDLVVKYSHGHLPRSLEPVSVESVRYIVIYGTTAYLANPADSPGGKFPPPLWTQPPEKAGPQLIADEGVWRKVINWEAAQQPLYYVMAGAWWRLGGWLGLDGGHLLYWLRFLNVLFVAAMVWLGHLAARMIFPGRIFLRLGVPALLAFIPQTAFYSIQNDVLSPLCFGAAFILTVKFLRAETPGLRLGTVAGLALAATFLTKISNLPLLAVSAAAILFKVRQLSKAGKLRGAMPSLVSLALCAALPMAGWMAWCKCVFGNFTGSAAKIKMLDWTVKPFAEWRHHPIFTPHGFWIFIHDLLATFWQGEFLWHRQPLALPPVDMVYVILTFIFVGAALLNLLSRSKPEARPRRQALWFGLAGFIALIAFSGFLSIIYDFHDCFYPSQDHPYFTSGRLMLGALIPFALLYVHGLDRILKNCGNAAKFSALAGMILFMVVSEITIDWQIFPDAYNWFHM